MHLGDDTCTCAHRALDLPLARHVFRTNEDCSGDDSKFYWILDGAVEVKDQSAMEGEGAVGDRLSSGAFFGDIALLAKGPRRQR